MRSLAIPVALILTASFAGPVTAQEYGSAPRLDYHMDGYQDAYATYPAHGSQSTGYNGRWTGTWEGADGRRYSGTYEGSFDGTAKGRELTYQDMPPPPPAYGRPDPAYYGSGQVVGGWYYPPAVVTRTVVEYRLVR